MGSGSSVIVRLLQGMNLGLAKLPQRWGPLTPDPPRRLTFLTRCRSRGVEQNSNPEGDLDKVAVIKGTELDHDDMFRIHGNSPELTISEAAAEYFGTSSAVRTSPRSITWGNVPRYRRDRYSSFFGLIEKLDLKSPLISAN
jgi:hypothetical protein